MTGHDGDTIAVPTDLDPGTLRERDDVPCVGRTYPHEDTDHCAADAAGRVIVGVRNGDGAVLAVVDADGDHALLPNRTVDADDDWAAVARDTAGEVAGAPVTLTGVERLRRVEHVLEGADDREPHAVTHQVVLAGTVDGTVDPGVEDEGWTAGWYRAFPVSLDGDAAHGDAVADLRRFIPDG